MGNCSFVDEYGENFIVGCDAKYTRGRIAILHSFSSRQVASAVRGRFTVFHIDGEFPVKGFLRITISVGFLVHQRQLVCAFSVVGQLQVQELVRLCHLVCWAFSERYAQSESMKRPA
jgi:hypothetical protein